MHNTFGPREHSEEERASDTRAPLKFESSRGARWSTRPSSRSFFLFFHTFLRYADLRSWTRLLSSLLFSVTVITSDGQRRWSITSRKADVCFKKKKQSCNQGREFFQRIFPDCLYLQQTKATTGNGPGSLFFELLDTRIYKYINCKLINFTLSERDTLG